MLFTLLNWLYILITCYICGAFVLARIFKGRGSIGGSVMCGIAVLTAYSEYYSLCSGVGLIANLILVFGCLLLVYIDREKYRENIKAYFKIFTGNAADKIIRTGAFVIIAGVVLVCAYFTAVSAFTYDTGTYHAQSIHWIETYGTVKGLAHMQTRLGFNNSYFSLCALFSFHFLGQSLHTMSGFLAALVMGYSVWGYAGHLCGFTAWKDSSGEGGRRHVVRVSDLAYIAPFAYFIITAVEITSPSTDYGVIWMIIWLLIRWIECMEDEPESGKDHDRIAVFSLLSVFSVFLVTVKLSVGVLALITVYPLVFLVREKRFKDIVKYVLSGLILVLPFFIRNYLITGWLVYPFPAVDLFNPDWKVPLEGVIHEADEVVVWARYTKDTALIDQTIREWFPVWWKEQGQANRFLSLSAFAGCPVILFRIIMGLRVYFGNDRADCRKEREYSFFGAILLICFAFFMITAPSNRFGYGYILMIPLYGAGDLCINLLMNTDAGKGDKPGVNRRMIIRVLMSGLVIMLTLCGFLRGIRMFAGEDKNYAINTGLAGFLVAQRDYPDAYATDREWEGMTIYYPVNEGEQIWYHAFPAILYGGNLEGIERRGNSVRDGFRLK